MIDSAAEDDVPLNGGQVQDGYGFGHEGAEVGAQALRLFLMVCGDKDRPWISEGGSGDEQASGHSGRT